MIRCPYCNRKLFMTEDCMECSECHEQYVLARRDLIYDIARDNAKNRKELVVAFKEILRGILEMAELLPPVINDDFRKEKINALITYIKGALYD